MIHINCSHCLEEKNVEVEMDVVEGIVTRTTDPYHDDKMGMWFECPVCHEQEDYIKEDDEYDEQADRELSSELVEYPELATF